MSNQAFPQTARKLHQLATQLNAPKSENPAENMRMFLADLESHRYNHLAAVQVCNTCGEPLEIIEDDSDRYGENGRTFQGCMNGLCAEFGKAVSE